LDPEEPIVAVQDLPATGTDVIRSEPLFILGAEQRWRWGFVLGFVLLHPWEMG